MALCQNQGFERENKAPLTVRLSYVWPLLPLVNSVHDVHLMRNQPVPCGRCPDHAEKQSHVSRPKRLWNANVGNARRGHLETLESTESAFNGGTKPCSTLRGMSTMSNRLADTWRVEHVSLWLRWLRWWSDTKGPGRSGSARPSPVSPVTSSINSPLAFRRMLLYPWCDLDPSNHIEGSLRPHTALLP